ncbi:hypothetical protein [Thiococcus pfennigii]|jgi:hypothetical protein|uniref:hypothetical protein n=1 Tax=Thiococcus pfennigii TaxID=1057 RepID=UPI001903E655|nr:hypothetical protein [Thiococcus pfennigii]
MKRESLIFVLCASTTIALAVGVESPLAEENGAIHACVGKAGRLRIVEAQAECKNRETYLTWNLTGPTGEQGPEGPAGPERMPAPDFDSGWERCEPGCGLDYCSEALSSGEFLIDIKFRCHSPDGDYIFSWLHPAYHSEGGTDWTVDDQGCLNVYIDSMFLGCDYRIGLWFYGES